MPQCGQRCDAGYPSHADPETDPSQRLAAIGTGNLKRDSRSRPARTTPISTANMILMARIRGAHAIDDADGEKKNKQRRSRIGRCAVQVLADRHSALSLVRS